MSEQPIEKIVEELEETSRLAVNERNAKIYAGLCAGYMPRILAELKRWGDELEAARAILGGVADLQAPYEIHSRYYPQEAAKWVAAYLAKYKEGRGGK